MGHFIISSSSPEYLLSVTGVGMSEEVQHKIFEPFFSASQEGGTGLSMAIVKHIIKSHGGNISISSKENVGTKFEIQLPDAIP